MFKSKLKSIRREVNDRYTNIRRSKNGKNCGYKIELRKKSKKKSKEEKNEW